MLHKDRVREESWFDNTAEANLMMKARLNVLKVNARYFDENVDVRCRFGEEETLEHFLLWCDIYHDLLRLECPVLHRPYEEDCLAIMGRLLLFVAPQDEWMCIRIVAAMWRRRCGLAIVG